MVEVYIDIGVLLSRYKNESHVIPIASKNSS